jgi:hypothetical protein
LNEDLLTLLVALGLPALVEPPLEGLDCVFLLFELHPEEVVGEVLLGLLLAQLQVLPFKPLDLLTLTGQV